MSFSYKVISPTYCPCCGAERDPTDDHMEHDEECEFVYDIRDQHGNLMPKDEE